MPAKHTGKKYGKGTVKAGNGIAPRTAVVDRCSAIREWQKPWAAAFTPLESVGSDQRVTQEQCNMLERETWRFINNRRKDEQSI